MFGPLVNSETNQIGSLKACILTKCIYGRVDDADAALQSGYLGL